MASLSAIVVVRVIVFNEISVWQSWDRVVSQRGRAAATLEEKEEKEW